MSWLDDPVSLGDRTRKESGKDNGVAGQTAATERVNRSAVCLKLSLSRRKKEVGEFRPAAVLSLWKMAAARRPPAVREILRNKRRTRSKFSRAMPLPSSDSNASLPSSPIV